MDDQYVFCYHFHCHRSYYSCARGPKLQKCGSLPNSSCGIKNFKTKNLCVNVFVKEYHNFQRPRTMFGSIWVKNLFSGFCCFEIWKSYDEFWTQAALLHDIVLHIFPHQSEYNTHWSGYLVLPTPHFLFSSAFALWEKSELYMFVISLTYSLTYSLTHSLTNLLHHSVQELNILWRVMLIHFYTSLLSSEVSGTCPDHVWICLDNVWNMSGHV